jgi:protein arginine N-methyltransferase 1
MFQMAIRPEEVLKVDTTNQTGQLYDSIDFNEEEEVSSLRKSNQIFWQIASAAKIYGFCVWWEAELVPGIVLSTSPFEPTTHWEQVFLPLHFPLSLKPGDTLGVEIESDSRLEELGGGCLVNWKAVQMRNGKILSTVKNTKATSK